MSRTHELPHGRHAPADPKRGATPLRIYTIGHSTRSLDELVAALSSFEIDTLVDVRSVPRSRTNPQFNIDTLPSALAHHGISYVHERDLGGLRSARKGEGPSPNGGWDHPSFRNYADHALTPAFDAALARLIDRARHARCAIMCAEAVWWRCHRRIIADHLIARGVEVEHIAGEGKSERAKLTEFACVEPGGRVTYPALV